MSAPCGGCPPCCASCIFSGVGEVPAGTVATILSSAEYGCVRGGDDIVHHDGKLGQMRDGAFHPVTEAGQRFLEETRNHLALAI